MISETQTCGGAHHLHMLDQIGIARKGMHALRPLVLRSFPTRLPCLFAHDPFYAFMVECPSLPPSLVSDTTIAVGGPLGCFGFKSLLKRFFIGGPCIMRR